MILGAKINGRALQYYVEARDGGGKVTASNGKAASPNIMPLKSPPPKAKASNPPVAAQAPPAR